MTENSGRGGQRNAGRHKGRNGNRRRSKGARKVWGQMPPEQLAARAAALPVVDFPDLPVSDHREEIAEAIKNHQVVIVAGETGSGKTTQLPKICLQLGRGIGGMIGHTQPRRLAARSVAERIAFELGQEVGNKPGQVVGYQVRFTDEVGPTTLIKLMTDGILLNEIQIDPDLHAYDTIIVDEAHERSLNIDFILGYLARLLPRRPDLKLIITSATIDSQKFADHFSQLIGQEVPVVEVSGRTYPVEIRYRPLAADTEPVAGESAKNQLVLEDQSGDLPTLGYGLGEDIDLEQGLCEAVDELLAEPAPSTGGDILVFLPGERDIREAAQALEDHLASKPRSRQAEVIPLFARLSAAEQHRIFQPHGGRRIILSTNIAETSLTVPGIRYVIDPGLARISRFSNKTKVQRLPIERVSQASANQRAGRAGRLSDGIAIRLYSQNDFLKRDEYTEPEILRTSLAAVILQMAALHLGEVADFPFIDAPSSRAVRDGVQLLVEIGALTDEGELTAVGRQLARLPIDPRLGRMLLAAADNGCSSEVLVIVAALSIQDVRERPLEAQAAADQAHARFSDSDSDFMTYLNLWRYLTVQSRDLSGSQFRRLCRSEFFHYLRFREWRDVVGQLRQMCRQLHIPADPVGEPSRKEAAADPVQAVMAYGSGTAAVDADQIHRSLLVGLLSNIGNWDEVKRNYAGTRGARFNIWPGSGLSPAHPNWVMAAELVETSRLFARTVARIKVEWIESAAGHLVSRSYSEPYWSKSNGAAMIKERVMLYGLTLAADRSVLLGRLGDQPIGGAVSAGKVSVANPGTIAAIAQGLLDQGLLESKSNGDVAIPAGVRQKLQPLGQDSSKQAALTATELAHEMFLRHALVQSQWRSGHLAFVKHNRQLVDEARDWEQRSRRPGLVASEEDRLEFFAERVPERITSSRAFENWWKKKRQTTPDLLNYSWGFLVRDQQPTDKSQFPDFWKQGDLRLPLSYDFQPGSARDGITVTVPLTLLPQVKDEGFDWLVPGLLEDLCVATIRALPKDKRRFLAPAPTVGGQIAEILRRQLAGEPAATDNTVFEAAEVAPAAGTTPDAKRAQMTSPSPDTQVPQATEPTEADPHSLESSLERLAQWGLRSGTVNSRSAVPKTSPSKPVEPAVVKSKQENKTTSTKSPDFFPSFAAAANTVSANSSLPTIDLSAEDGEIAAGKLPPHLQIFFQIVDGKGKVVAEGPSLTHLQQQLSRKADKAITNAVKSAVKQAVSDEQKNPQLPSSSQVVGKWNQNDLTDFPSTTLPPNVESRGPNGLVVRGYPALISETVPTDLGKITVSLRLRGQLDEATRDHRRGVAALLARDLHLATGRITSRWTGRQALLLASAPYGSTEELVADAQMAAAISLVNQYLATDGKAQGLNSRESYEALRLWARDRFEEEVYQILQAVVKTLEAVGQLQSTITECSGDSVEYVRREVKRDLKRLVYPGFLTATPREALPHLPRYIQASALRLEKAAKGIPSLVQDEKKADDLDRALAAWEQAKNLAERRPFSLHVDSELQRLQWLIEELRVSLFAEQLRTAQRVSVTRLLRQIQELQSGKSST